MRTGTPSADSSLVETEVSGGGAWDARAAPRALNCSIMPSALPPRIGRWPRTFSYCERS
jgi:hypothetical protein